jgi:cell fate regulator YaaT (PSP1 superfamily)
VKYAPTGPTIDCDSGTLVFRQGEAVVVDDRRGGTVATVSVPTTARKGAGSLGRILRRAEPRDLARAQEEQRRQDDALAFARSRAHALRLPIKVFRVDFDHGGDRALFFFSSEKRVDFRDLVRDLSARLRARIEMRQVGVRDEAKLVGGIGSCGRELCCSTFLPHFAPVSIKMAKNQRLVLNPTKVAGQCGRLKCCLMYEDAQYVEAGKGMPKVGKQVHTPDGVGRVDDINVLARKVRVSFFDRPSETFDASEVRPLDANATPSPAPGTPPPHDGPAMPEEDVAGMEDLADAAKDASSSTPPPAGESVEEPHSYNQEVLGDSSRQPPAAENTEVRGEDTGPESKSSR